MMDLLRDISPFIALVGLVVGLSWMQRRNLWELRRDIVNLRERLARVETLIDERLPRGTNRDSKDR